MENQDQEPLQEQVAGDELLPPFIIVSSSAKEGNRKLDAKMFPAFRQVVGTYGFQREYYHDNVFAATSSGYVINMYAIICSIWYYPITHTCAAFFLFTVIITNSGTDNEIFRTLVLEHLVPLYPDASDVPGKRVIMKADSGPSRSHIAFLAGSMLIMGFTSFLAFQMEPK